MLTSALTCHPATPCRRIKHFAVWIGWLSETQLGLRYVIEGELGGLQIPQSAPPERRERLWESTCLEAFLRVPGSAAYCEFNFAPSTAWAAYAFRAYRNGMRPLPAENAPELSVRATPRRFELAARIKTPGAWGPLRTDQPLLVGIAAVMEERDGSKSYWSLHHPPGHPDFHHPDCFALTLASRGTCIPS